MLGSKQFAYISGITSTLQFHIVPVGNVYLSVSLISGCAAIGSVRYIRELLRYPWFLLAAFLFVVQAVSLLWAYNHRLGARMLVYQIPFFALSLAMVQLAQVDRQAALRLLKLTLASTSIEALLVIIFRVVPTLKIAYLTSPIADLFESANRVADVGNSVYSILDPSKSAGISTYPNPAATWLGMAAMSSWYVSRLCSSRLLTYVAILNFAAVFFTGSKAGILTACFIVAVVWALEASQQIVNTRRLDLRYMVVACLGLASACLVFLLVLQQISRLLSDSAYTLSTRRELWWFAEDEFRRHPFWGLGFGAWERLVPIQGREVHMPPHNAFIILWAQSGIVAAIIGAAFSVSLLVWSLTRVFRGSHAEQLVAKGLFTGYLWLFIQAQGENFGLFGEDHMKPILAFMAGLLAALRLPILSSVDRKTPSDDAVVVGLGARNLVPETGMKMGDVP